MTKLVSDAEIKCRKESAKVAEAIFAVDNLKPNPETQHIFDDYDNGRIATTEEVIKLLKEHYNVERVRHDRAK